MNEQDTFPPVGADYDAEAAQTVMAMADGLGRTMCIARVLLQNGRTVDLTGLDRGIGLLCAKALDLPLDVGRSVQPSLTALLREADELTGALHGQAPACSPI